MIRRSVFVIGTVSILLVSSVKAQTSKVGPMAKLTHNLVLLHEQHLPRYDNVARHHLTPMTLWSRWSMTAWWWMP